jgi:DNA-binding transcriptional MocR family regulator
MAMQTAQVEVRSDFIDLGVGQPAPSLLPASLIARAAEHRFAAGVTGYLQYGIEQGDGYFREALARFLTETHGIVARPERLFVTAGASQGLDLVCTLFVPPGSVVCVEEPSYFLALNILADHRLRVVSLPTDEHGLVVDGLEARLAELAPAMLYLIPTFQNPTGATLPLGRRERLVELCRARGILLVADEVYHCLSYGEPPPRSFGGFVEGGQVLSLGSFSKILAPGLRLGWIQADEARVARLVQSGLLDSGGGLNPLGSGLVRSILELDLERPHLERLRNTFRDRIGAMSDALERELPTVRFSRPAGGYFFWLTLPDGLDAAALLSEAESSGVGFRPGIRFSSQGGLRDRLRLSFAFYETEQLLEGARRLGRALERALR